jgi:hypothetical protein
MAPIASAAVPSFASSASILSALPDRKSFTRAENVIAPAGRTDSSEVDD